MAGTGLKDPSVTTLVSERSCTDLEKAVQNALSTGSPLDLQFDSSIPEQTIYLHFKRKIFLAPELWLPSQGTTLAARTLTL